MGAANQPGTHMAWRRQPLVWLALAVFALLLAGCVAMLVLGLHLADEPLPGVGEQVLKVPLSRAPPREGR